VERRGKRKWLQTLFRGERLGVNVKYFGFLDLWLVCFLLSLAWVFKFGFIGVFCACG